MIDNKKYIGQSVDISERWRIHICELKYQNHHNVYLQEAWNKYGKENFKFYILEYCDIDQLDDKERYYISLYNSIDRSFGYNLMTGGLSKGSLCEEGKKKLSKILKKIHEENPSLAEKTRSNTIDYWSNTENLKYHSGERNGMYGKHHTEEAKEKMSRARKASSNFNPKPRKVLCKELNRIFDSAKGAGEKLNLSGSNILAVCYGKRKTCGGYHWSFVE